MMPFPVDFPVADPPEGWSRPTAHAAMQWGPMRPAEIWAWIGVGVGSTLLVGVAGFAAYGLWLIS